MLIWLQIQKYKYKYKIRIQKKKNTKIQIQNYKLIIVRPMFIRDHGSCLYWPT